MSHKKEDNNNNLMWIFIVSCVVLVVVVSILSYLYYIRRKRSKIYVIITTCILDDAPDYMVRRKEYENGIQRVLENVQHLDPPVRVIVVENNNHSSTYLDHLGTDVLYTNNNNFTTYKGDNELKDVHDCLCEYNIQDDDFVVKITGRYLWDSNSPFLHSLSKLHPDTQCIVRYGGYGADAPPHPVGDCVTGLIGMRARHIRKIPYRFEKGESIEMEWGIMASSLPQEHVDALPTLGVLISPGGQHDFYRI